MRLSWSAWWLLFRRRLSQLPSCGLLPVSQEGRWTITAPLAPCTAPYQYQNHIACLSEHNSFRISDCVRKSCSCFELRASSPDARTTKSLPSKLLGFSCHTSGRCCLRMLVFLLWRRYRDWSQESQNPVKCDRPVATRLEFGRPLGAAALLIH